jgi:hypothetical protein
MTTPDEPSLRRDDFREGVPIRLWDGREWTFPRPMVAGFYPHRGPDGALEFVPGFDLGPEYDRLTDRYVEEEDPRESSELLLNVAALLLLRNYRLTDADLPLLLYRVPATDARYDECDAMWRSIVGVAFGIDPPKPTPGGSGSSSPRMGSPDPAR